MWILFHVESSYTYNIHLNGLLVSVDSLFEQLVVLVVTSGADNFMSLILRNYQDVHEINCTLFTIFVVLQFGFGPA